LLAFAPLTEQDAAIYFGREAQIVRRIKTGISRLRMVRKINPSRYCAGRQQCR
jgi:hypothetical protein